MICHLWLTALLIAIAVAQAGAQGGIPAGTVRVVSATGAATIPVSTTTAAMTSLVTGQQAVTAVATALPSTAGKLVCLKVIDGGTQTVKYGPAGVTTATGQELVPGQGACRPLDNANRIFVIATGAGSTVAWEVLN